MSHMSYTPKHGGKKKTSKPTEPSDISSVEPFTPQNKKRAKIVAIILLVLFAAGIILALIFIIKPVFATEETPAATEASAPAHTEAATVVENTGSYTSSNPVLQYSDGEIPTSGERHDVTVAADGGADAMEIIGTWYVDKWTAYIFDGYGRGVMLTSNDNYTFAYSAQYGQLIVDYDNDKGMDTEYSYILDGDKLTLKRGKNEYKLTRELEQEQTQEPTAAPTQEQTQVSQ